MMKAILMAMFVLTTWCFGQITIAAEPLTQPVYAIPQINNLVVDGRADDWGTLGFKVEAMVNLETGRISSTANFDPRFRLAWNQKGLLILVEVDDDVADESANDKALYERDSVEIFLATKRGSADWVQVVIAPGTDPRHPALRYTLYDHRSKEMRKTAVTAEFIRTATKRGYILEALLPWVNLGLTPKVGDEVAFQLILNEADGNTTSKTMWYPVDGASWNSNNLYRLQLSDTPSPAIRFACNGGYERFRRTRIGVVATGELAGHSVTINDGDREIGKGILTADGRRASTEVICPMPAPDKAYNLLTVLVDGTAAGSVTLPDPRPARREAFEGASMRLTPSCVFSGTAFPTCDFEQPSMIEDLIGEYQLHTDYYAADFTKVNTAEKPGRYGAIVTITAANGFKFKRFITLFKRPNPIAIDTPSFMQDKIPDEIVSELRIDPRVIEEQSSYVLEGITRYFSLAAKLNASYQSPAVFMSWLYEMKPGTVTVMRNREWQKNGSWWFELKNRTGDYKLCNYKLRLPKKYDADPTVRHPLILLMGAVETTPGDTTFGNSDIDIFADSHPDFPFIVVNPIGWWQSTYGPRDMGALLDYLLVNYRIDPDRVYVTGASIGGNQTWAWAADQPDRFAAIVPLCSFMDTTDAARLKNLPIWIFHGEIDAAVPIDVSYRIKAAFDKAGGNCKLTVYPGVNHNCWAQTYANPDLYTWMLKQNRGQKSK